MRQLTSFFVMLLLIGAMASCHEQGESPPLESSSVFSQSKEPSVVICVEEGFEQDIKELLNYLSASSVETEYELQVLPTSTEEREAELTRLRTEIMAGEGPDAFILSTAIPGAVLDPSTGETMEPLFPNVEKSMYSHLFLDLEDMVQASDVIDLENCNQTVMNVGVTGDGRFLLPLTYTFSAHIFDCSALRDSEYTFSTLGEVLMSDEAALKGTLAWSTLAMFPNCLGPLADYEGQNLLVTRESLQTAVEQADAFVALQDEAYSESNLVYPGGGLISWYGLMALQQEETAYTVFPIPGPEGGVMAAVTTYAAVNRNTAHPQEAFAFLELLFREELALQAGLEANGYHHASAFQYGTDAGFSVSLPVKDQLALDYFAPQMQPDTMASLRAAIGRIDSAKVYSNLDQDIYQLYETWHWSYGRSEEPLEELVERTISSMEMTLAE